MKYKLILVLLASLALTACGAVGQTPTPLPTIVLGSGDTTTALQTPSAAQGAVPNNGGVTASGIVVSDHQTNLAFTLEGKVKSVDVAEGDQVKAGQTLVELENASVQLEVDQAQRALAQLTSPAGVAAAEQSVASAQKALDDAQKKADSLIYPRASDELIKNTQGEIDLAKQQVARAADSYRQVARLPDGDTRKATALVNLTNAQMNLNTLIAKYNWYTGMPNDTDAALAKANLDAAKANLQEAQWYLSALKGDQVPADATGSDLAQLAQARDALATAREQLDATRLVAPFAATVATVSVSQGEAVAPGQVLVMLSDVDHLHIETTDLSERDVPNVKVGQVVTVSVKALNQDLAGHVSVISPVADTLGGDVVYQTIIKLDSPPPAALRVGMSVEVQFGTQP